MAAVFRKSSQKSICVIQEMNRPYCFKLIQFEVGVDLAFVDIFSSLVMFVGLMYTTHLC